MTIASSHRRRTVATALLATILTLPALAGCAQVTERLEESKANSSGKPVVLTTFTVIADMAENVAGDRLEVHSITKLGAEIHGYEPSPLDIAKASEADLILDNGLGLEAWFERFVDQAGAPHAVLSRGVEPIAIAGSAETSAGSRNSQASDAPSNPHAWMSPAAGQVYVQNIVAAFSELDPEGAEVYERNGARYAAEIDEVGTELRSKLESIPETQRALVSCEGAFSYLARDAGLTERYLWAVNAEQQTTPKQLAATIEFVDANSVPAVFCESTVSSASMQQVVTATETKFGGTLYVDSLSEPDGPVPSYLELLRYDAELIAAALTENHSTAEKDTK